MRKSIGIVLACIVAAGIIGTAPAALAKDGDVIKTGQCTGASDWKLKLSNEDGKMEVEFEVDQNVNGDEWRIVLKREGEAFWRGTRVTKAPSGSFEVEKLTQNGPGEETFFARARNLETDEICKGTATK